MAGPTIDPRDLRVSDAERAHVMSLLEKATGRGLINLAEFDERSAKAVAAKTRADLNTVLLDLPGLVYSTGSGTGLLQRTPGADPGRVEFATPPPGQGGSPAASSLELVGRGPRDLRGYWVVPARIVIGGTGATRLDFCDAQLTSRTVRIEFTGGRHGSVELIVPPGTGVRMDELIMHRGGVDNQVAPGAGSGGWQLVLAGEKRGGWLRIRHPRRGLFGWG